jgi:Asp-tRNA(Asn)/Glu-tRNA(Gln) amidotransferase A subunit family amidase
MHIINDENLTIIKVASLIRKRHLSPVELTKAFLERIARLQPTLNAFITITSDLALKQAREAEREISRGRYRLVSLLVLLITTYWAGGMMFIPKILFPG